MQSRMGFCAGVLAFLVLAACGGDSPRLRPARRLVEETHPAGAVPLAKVGAVFRPVLTRPPPCAPLVYRFVPRSPGRAVIHVAVPETLRGWGLQVYASIAQITGEVPVGLRADVPLAHDEAAQVVSAGLGQGTGIAPLEPPAAPATAPRESVTFVIDGAMAGHDALLAVHGCPWPEQRHETAAFAVPERAHLRFALGVERLAKERAVARFTLAALVDGREDELFDARFASAPKGWEEHEVDLSRYGGRTIALRFTTAVAVEDDGAVPPLVWADPTIVTEEASAEPRWNVLLVSLDTVRPDRLGCYGYARVTSPAIDAELAARGTLFTRAFASFPSTAGSHATIMTSLDPCAHGFVDTMQPPALRADAPTLAELLRGHGYETAAITEDGWLLVRLGFGRGFGTYVEYSWPDAEANGSSAGAAATFATALEWIEAHRSLPWFAFVHTYQTHHPYLPPAGYLERIGASATRATTSDEYDAEIRYTDDVLGGLLAGLERLGLGARTVVVLLSDHGEQFGEHGLEGHGNALWDTILRVPLIIRAPGRVPAAERIDAPVGLIDVLPTILDLLGLPPYAQAQGRSLVPLLRGGELPERTLFAEVASYTDQIGAHVTARRGDVKWIIEKRTGSAFAFDVRRDPREEHDLSAQMPPEIPRQILEQFQRHCATLPVTLSGSPALDADERARLRALGYLE